VCSKCSTKGDHKEDGAWDHRDEWLCHTCWGGRATGIEDTDSDGANTNVLQEAYERRLYATLKKAKDRKVKKKNRVRVAKEVSKHASEDYHATVLQPRTLTQLRQRKFKHIIRLNQSFLSMEHARLAEAEANEVRGHLSMCNNRGRKGPGGVKPEHKADYYRSVCGSDKDSDDGDGCAYSLVVQLHQKTNAFVVTRCV
jgi:hypothetical protein